MNIGNESTNPKGNVPQPEILKNLALRPEEVKMYKDCTFGLYYKAGLPFAIFCQVLSSFFREPGKAKLTNQFLLKQGLIFCGNLVLGTFLFAPLCYNKLAAMRAEFEKKNKELEGQEISHFEGPQPITQPEDFGYPIDIVSNLNESEGSFSSDFTTTKPITDDSESIKLPRTTTYQDLRAQHRSNYSKTVESFNLDNSYGGEIGNSLNLEPDLGLGMYSPPVEKPVSNEPRPPQRFVRKNIYGDEVE